MRVSILSRHYPPLCVKNLPSKVQGLKVKGRKVGKGLSDAGVSQQLNFGRRKDWAGSSSDPPRLSTFQLFNIQLFNWRKPNLSTARPPTDVGARATASPP